MPLNITTGTLPVNSTPPHLDGGPRAIIVQAQYVFYATFALPATLLAALSAMLEKQWRHGPSDTLGPTIVDRNTVRERKLTGSRPGNPTSSELLS